MKTHQRGHAVAGNGGLVAVEGTTEQSEAYGGGLRLRLVALHEGLLSELPYELSSAVRRFKPQHKINSATVECCAISQ